MNPTPKVSVIVPIYNVERYIEKSVCSLLEQTLEDIEFIFVDDCGQDKSIDILLRTIEKYPERRNQIKIIRHKDNLGVSVARQNGVDNASGEYIIHFDPDDWIEKDAYKTLYEEAKKSGAQILICDYYEDNGKESRYKQSEVHKSKQRILYDISSKSFHTGLHSKFIARNFLLSTGIKFNKNLSLWEDMAYMIPLLLTADNIVHINKAFYHYNSRNEGSLTNTISNKIINSQILAANEITNYIYTAHSPELFMDSIHTLQLYAKDYYLVKGETYNPHLWRDTFPEAHRSVWNKQISTGKKVLYTVARLRLDKLLRFLVNRRKR